MSNEELIARLRHLLPASQPLRWTAATGGYTAAERWVVHHSDGASAFLKVATDQTTAGWLRTEYRIYSQVAGDYMPRMLGWDDDGEYAILVLEDLSGAHWPPPWTQGQVDTVLKTLEKVRATLPPPDLPPIDRSALVGWSLVAEDPTSFLKLGLCSETWLKKALPELVDAESRAPLEGNELVHLDVRSDNICFAQDRTLLIDWNMACRGNGLFDQASWLPSLHAEGGPLPEEVLPNAPEFAAITSGFFAARAGLPLIERAPGVRRVQLQQLESALPWAIRALGLPPPK